MASTTTTAMTIQIQVGTSAILTDVSRRRRRDPRPCGPAGWPGGSRRRTRRDRRRPGSPSPARRRPVRVPWRGIWSSGLPRTSMIALRVRAASSQPLVSASASASSIRPASARRLDRRQGRRWSAGPGTSQACCSCSSCTVHSTSASPPRPSLVCVVGSAPRGSRSVSTRALIRRISTTSRWPSPPSGYRNASAAATNRAPSSSSPATGRARSSACRSHGPREPGPVAAERRPGCGPAGRCGPPDAGSRRSRAAGPGSAGRAAGPSGRPTADASGPGLLVSSSPGSGSSTYITSASEE